MSPPPSTSPLPALGLALALAACGAARAPARPPQPQPAQGVRTQAFNFTDELVESRIGPTIEDDPLPPAFAALSPREREQWHACRPLLMHRRRGRDCLGMSGMQFVPSPRGGVTLNRDPSRGWGGEIVFALHAADYVALPDAAARRAMLQRAGCPDWLLDLADGTRLDIVEGPAGRAR